MTLLAELDSLLILLEAEIPANPNSPGNVRQEKRLQTELSKYFKKLEDAFPLGAIEQLYYKKLGISESERPPKPIIIEEPLVEIPEIITIQGEKGERGVSGEKGDKGDTGESGEQGLPGLKGERGLRGETGDRGEQGENGLQGERGEQGLAGKKGERGEKGEKGDTGDTGLSKDQQKSIKKIIKDFSGKNFVADDDPRLKDERKPKDHKHPEIQPLSFAYPVMNVAGVSGGVQSEPPEGYLEVTNVYYDPETEKMVVVYKGG